MEYSIDIIESHLLCIIVSYLPPQPIKPYDLAQLLHKFYYNVFQSCVTVSMGSVLLINFHRFSSTRLP